MQATTQGITLQGDNQAVWVQELRVDDHTNVESTSDELTIALLSKHDIRQAQEEDPAIKRLLMYKALGRRPTRKERKGEPKLTTTMMYELSKMKVDKDGILHRHTESRSQLVLPPKFKQLELHINAGHLGPERVAHGTRTILLASHGICYTAFHHQGVPMSHAEEAS